MTTPPISKPGNPAGHRLTVQREAAARLYHNWMTGLVLSLLNHAGPEAAEQFVFRLFRQQHLQRFLPGLKKLGLDQLPDAQAAAQYHYFSNQLGGVKVEYLAESDRKAWVRYPPPRWIWDGTAICAIPTRVNAAMMHGWHAHNGVSLNNPRLGFVCTGMTTDGAPGLEGYYIEEDQPLSAEQRLRFAPDEQCPPIAAGSMPVLDAMTWPPGRQAKATLNYAMEYIRNALPLLAEGLPAALAERIGALCARQTGMHSIDFLAAALAMDEIDSDSDAGFARLMATLLQTDGSLAEAHGNSVTLRQWRLFEIESVSPACVAQFTECLAGMLSVRNRFAHLHCERSNDGKKITWQVLSSRPK